jgi:hypothetical protein
MEGLRWSAVAHESGVDATFLMHFTDKDGDNAN